MSCQNGRSVSEELLLFGPWAPHHLQRTSLLRVWFSPWSLNTDVLSWIIFHRILYADRHHQWMGQKHGTGKEHSKQGWCQHETLLHTIVDWEGVQRGSITQNMLVWYEITMLESLGEQPITPMRSSNRPFLLTKSKALVRSMNIMYNGWPCSLLFSWSCLREKILSVVDLPALKPHWGSG